MNPDEFPDIPRVFVNVDASAANKSRAESSGSVYGSSIELFKKQLLEHPHFRDRHVGEGYLVETEDLQIVPYVHAPFYTLAAISRATPWYDQKTPDQRRCNDITRLMKFVRFNNTFVNEDEARKILNRYSIADEELWEAVAHFQRLYSQRREVPSSTIPVSFWLDPSKSISGIDHVKLTPTMSPEACKTLRDAIVEQCVTDPLIKQLELENNAFGPFSPISQNDMIQQVIDDFPRKEFHYDPLWEVLNQLATDETFEYLAKVRDEFNIKVPDVLPFFLTYEHFDHLSDAEVLFVWQSGLLAPDDYGIEFETMLECKSNYFTEEEWVERIEGWIKSLPNLPNSNAKNFKNCALNSMTRASNKGLWAMFTTVPETARPYYLRWFIQAAGAVARNRCPSAAVVSVRRQASKFAPVNGKLVRIEKQRSTYSHPFSTFIPSKAISMAINEIFKNCTLGTILNGKRKFGKTIMPLVDETMACEAWILGGTDPRGFDGCVFVAETFSRRPLFNGLSKLFPGNEQLFEWCLENYAVNSRLLLAGGFWESKHNRFKLASGHMLTHLNTIANRIGNLIGVKRLQLRQVLGLPYEMLEGESPSYLTDLIREHFADSPEKTLTECVKELLQFATLKMTLHSGCGDDTMLGLGDNSSKIIPSFTAYREVMAWVGMDIDDDKRKNTWYDHTDDISDGMAIAYSGAYLMIKESLPCHGELMMIATRVLCSIFWGEDYPDATSRLVNYSDQLAPFSKYYVHNNHAQAIFARNDPKEMAEYSSMTTQALRETLDSLKNLEMHPDRRKIVDAFVEMCPEWFYMSKHYFGCWAFFDAPKGGQSADDRIAELVQLRENICSTFEYEDWKGRGYHGHPVIMQAALKALQIHGLPGLDADGNAIGLKQIELKGLRQAYAKQRKRFSSKGSKHVPHPSDSNRHRTLSDTILSEYGINHPTKLKLNVKGVPITEDEFFGKNLR